MYGMYIYMFICVLMVLLVRLVIPPCAFRFILVECVGSFHLNSTGDPIHICKYHLNFINVCKIINIVVVKNIIHVTGQDRSNTLNITFKHLQTHLDSIYQTLGQDSPYSGDEKTKNWGDPEASRCQFRMGAQIWKTHGFWSENDVHIVGFPHRSVPLDLTSLMMVNGNHPHMAELIFPDGWYLVVLSYGCVMVCLKCTPKHTWQIVTKIMCGENLDITKKCSQVVMGPFIQSLQSS